MRLVSFDDGRIGVTDGKELVDVTAAAGLNPGAWPPVGMVQVIAAFDRFRPIFERAWAEGPRRPLGNVRLEAPIRWPNKVIAFPANYHAHIEEMRPSGRVISQANAKGQGFFLKANSSLSGPADAIVLPPLDDREIHHECELGVVIGRGGRQISREAALEHIMGYTCLLDMVVRGQEERVMRKSFDTFCPIGPWIATSDEVPDVTNLSMHLTVNGMERQRANTRNLIVDVPEMIAMASAVMTLEPGDIIASGTPAGVGPVRAGDEIRIEIDHVGSMTLPVVAGQAGAHSVWSAAKEATA